jgi:type III pantothenate kinase
MSLLTIDAGNTNTVFGVHDGPELRAHWRLTTRREQTADEYGVLVRNLFAGSNVDPAQIQGVALASVVPPLTPVLIELSRDYLGQEPLVVEPGVKTGLPILYEPASDVGADRIVNGVAALARYGAPVVVVDFGTATTFDVVSPKGEYIGGAIAPGIEISLEALGRRGAQLRKVELLRPRTVIAKNTVEALQSGVIFGFASQVDGIVTRMIAELKHEPSTVNVIATGGLAPVVVDEASVFTDHQPWLTLLGLEIVFGRNS